MRINKECNKQHNSSLQKKKIQNEFWLRWAKIIIDRHWELVPVVSWMFVCLSRLSGTVCIDQTNKGGKQHCETPRSPPRLFGCYALDFTLFQHTVNSSQSSCTDQPAACWFRHTLPHSELLWLGSKILKMLFDFMHLTKERRKHPNKKTGTLLNVCMFTNVRMTQSQITDSVFELSLSPLSSLRPSSLTSISCWRSWITSTAVASGPSCTTARAYETSM